MYVLHTTNSPEKDQRKENSTQLEQLVQWPYGWADLRLIFVKYTKANGSVLTDRGQWHKGKLERAAPVGRGAV